MESSAYEDNRCCHELYKLLEAKAGEKLTGGVGFKFDELSLLMMGKTVSNRAVSLNLAQGTHATDFKLKILKLK